MSATACIKQREPPMRTGGYATADPTTNAMSISRSQSIFIIGMRGAGKTTIGTWLAEVLDWTFLDLDHIIEEQAGLSCSDIVRQLGWEEFRRREINVLKEAMMNKPQKHVFSCGGGIVESQEARAHLMAWKSIGVVLRVQRDTDEMVAYLMIDKTRPVYSEQIREVYERRKPWLEACSNFSYFNPHLEKNVTKGNVPHDFRDFVLAIQ